MRALKHIAAALALAAGAILTGGLLTGSALAQEGGTQSHEEPTLKSVDWSFDGFFGTFDRAAAQRGYQIYNEVCSTCHSLRLLYYRNLAGLGYTPEEVAAFASQKTVTAGPDDSGNMFERPALPSDHFVSPFANEPAARAANNGALPPDLSLIVEAREDGPDYVYSFLTGFADPPPDFTLMPGMYYNEAFPGHQVAMPDMVNDGGVTYAHGVEATEEQQAYDVVNFLTWAAEPNLEQRKALGVRVVLFLVVFTALMYAVKRKVWADVAH